MSTPTLRERVLVGFDLETSGVDVETCEIVTCTLVTCNPTTGATDVREWLLQPIGTIPDEAAAVHGITTQHALDHGTDHATGVREIHDAMQQAWTDGHVLVAYNGAYDFTLLDRECHRHLGHGLTINGPVLDPMVIDKHVDKYRRGSRKLIATATHYGIHLSEEDAHGSTADALAAARLAWILAPHLDMATDLHKWQADAYTTQQRSLASYFRKQGNTDAADDIASRTGWPITHRTNALGKAA